METFIPPRIAVLRGSSPRHAESIASGFGVLDALQRQEVDSVDVYIDEEGVWHTKGVLTNPHNVFAHVDGYIDTTEAPEDEYVSLANRMGVKRLFFSTHHNFHDDREMVYRLLRQGGVLVPESRVIRVEHGVPHTLLKEVWNALHTPYLIRPIHRVHGVSSVFVSSFDVFREEMRGFAEKLIDVHVIPYRSAETISTAVLPHYRGEKIYMPLSVTTLVGTREVPHKHASIVMLRAPEKEYNAIKKVVTRAYEVLGLNGPALVDVINTRKGYMVVEVQVRPSLRDDGRFMQSLKTTGVELGHYLSSRVV